jgi:hypothetical protein
MFRVISFVLVRERNHEIALALQGALAETGPNVGFDATDNLGEKRRIVIRKIDILR